MKFPVYEIVFYVYAVMMVAAALCVILNRNPVRSALFLVLTFFCSAVLWMMTQAEFLSLVLIFVYVGAVMTLFLFVVMMIHVDLSSLKEGYVKYFPLAGIMMLGFLAVLIASFSAPYLPTVTTGLEAQPLEYNNTAQLGRLLFTDYLYALECAGAILLVAMVAAIALAFQGRRPGTKFQNISEQHLTRPEDRLKMIPSKGRDK